METKILYIPKDLYIQTYLGFDNYTEMEDLAQWVLRTLNDEGEFKINLQENFEARDTIAFYLISEMDSDVTEDFLYELENEFGGELPLEFEYKGVNYKIELG